MSSMKVSTKKLLCLDATAVTIFSRSSRSFSVSLTMFPKSMNVARFSLLRLSIMMLPVCASLCITPLLNSASSIHFQMTCLKKSALWATERTSRPSEALILK